MRQRHVLVLTVLVGIFLVLAIMLVLTLIKGDDTDHRGATLPALPTVSALSAVSASSVTR